MSTTRQNVDAAEVAKFDALASRWWDPDGEFRSLHEINPLRLDWVRQHVDLDGCRALDVGCGGGILAESMAQAGATVTGVDMAKGPLNVARLHLVESGAEVDYQQATAEEMAARHPGEFDVVTCLEMLEHVPSPSGVIASARKTRAARWPRVFLDYQQKPKVVSFAIVGRGVCAQTACPPGHTNTRSSSARRNSSRGPAQRILLLRSSIGMQYNPLTREYSLGPNVDVNYLMYFQRPEAG